MLSYKCLSLIFCIIFFSAVAVATRLEVTIPETLEANLSFFEINSNGVINISYEFYNTGSIPYAGRVKSEIIRDNKTFTLWSEKCTYMPGMRKNYNLFFYGINGSYLIRNKAYVGNEIITINEGYFEIAAQTEDVFEVEARTYDNFVALEIMSMVNVTDIYIIPNSPIGWIFEQVKIKSLKEGQKKTVKMPYEASVFYPMSLKVIIASGDGKHMSSRSVNMEKQGGFAGIVGYIIDSIKIGL